MSATLFDVIIATLLLDQLKVFLNAHQVHVDTIYFCLPLDRVKASFENLFLLWLFEQVFVQVLRVEKVDLRLLNLALRCHFLGLIFDQSELGVAALFDLFDEDTIEFLRPVQIDVVCSAFVVALIVVWWEHGFMELIVSAVQLNVQQFIDDVADCLPVARDEVFRFACFCALRSEFLEVCQKLGQCVSQISLEVSKGYKNAKFFRLR